jgi:hypothetical protein
VGFLDVAERFWMIGFLLPQLDFCDGTNDSNGCGESAKARYQAVDVEEDKQRPESSP